MLTNAYSDGNDDVTNLNLTRRQRSVAAGQRRVPDADGCGQLPIRLQRRRQLYGGLWRGGHRRRGGEHGVVGQ